MNPKRKYTKRKHWKSRRRLTPTKNQRNKLLLIKQLYDNYGSLQKVADDLNITRERVRQLLLKGDYYKLYDYTPTRQRKFSRIKDKISLEVLIGILKNETNRFKICDILSISMKDLYKLISLYGIDFEDYRQDFRQRKFLMRYSNIVDKLGHHPSTTEMNNRPDWRSTWMGIDRIWGSIEGFRRQFGIERPPYNIHPNTLVAWRKSVLARQKAKQEKLNKVLGFIKSSNRPMDIKTITEAVKLRKQMVYMYLVELRDKGAIETTGSGIYMRYQICK